MPQAYVTEGEISDARHLVLDEPLAITGRVRVTVVPASKTSDQAMSHAEILSGIRARLKAVGHVPPTKEEMDRRIKEERDSWD